MSSVWKYVVLTGKSWWRGEGSDGGAVGEDAKGGQPHPPIMHRIFAFHVPQTYYGEFSFESVLL